MLAPTLPLNSAPPVSAFAEAGTSRRERTRTGDESRFEQELSRASARQSASDAHGAHEAPEARADSADDGQTSDRSTDSERPEAGADSGEAPDETVSPEDQTDGAEPATGDDDGTEQAQAAAVGTHDKSDSEAASAAPAPVVDTPAREIPRSESSDATPRPAGESKHEHGPKAPPATGMPSSHETFDPSATPHGDGEKEPPGQETSDRAPGMVSRPHESSEEAPAEPAREAQSPSDSSDSRTIRNADVDFLEGKANSATSALQLEVESAPQPKVAGSHGKSVDLAGAPAHPGSGSSNEQSEGAFRAGVSRGLAAALQQRGGSLTIRLSPESLGSLRIQMTLGEGQVSVRMETLNEHAQQMLMRSMPALRESLESKGLTVREIQVTPTMAHHQAAAPGADVRQDTPQDRGWDHGSDAQDQHSEDERGRGDDPQHDQQEQGDGQREHWFARRLRMTLNTVA